MNLDDPRDFRKLREAVKESYRKLDEFRRKRRSLIKSFVGSDYSGGGQELKVYLYLLTMATNIYVRQLAIRAPTATVTSPYQSLRPLAKNMSIACKDAADDVELGDILRKAVTDSLFSPVAALKVGLEYKGTEDYEGEDVDVTEPFIRKVSFDDYVRDMSARSADEPAYEGDRYYLSQKEFEARYPGVWEELELSGDGLGMQGDDGSERAESLSHEPTSGNDNFKDRVEMQDVFIHETGELVTYLVHKPTERPLDVIMFDSPEEGPYHTLWYTDVPDNAMPLAPFAILRNIHELANNLFRRIAQQARDEKSVVAFNDEESANRFKATPDGQALWWGDGVKPEMVKVGGINQVTLATFLQTKDVFSWVAGNLDSLGGLSPMSDTVGQDRMLAQSSGAQLADMQDAVTEFARKIFRQIAWYEWTDPVRSRVIQKEIPGTGDYIAVDWSPETRQGDFLDFNFDINPHSMREDDPAKKLARLQGIVVNFFQPLLPFFQQQGLTLDANRLVEMLGDYSNLPELEGLIVPMDPNMAQPPGQPSGDPIPKPATTTRRYERINRGGSTRPGKDAALAQTMLGGTPQPAVAATAGRPTG